ncbi:hypothetical protein [Oceanobacillus oncorhynchi]|uniref:hypothetical protein n=1 Tax=Oceanobacillus oncorhynchi TaxID=545501 RepID=UPI0034D71D5B
MNEIICEIRYEGYYIEEDNAKIERKHNSETLKLLTQAMDLVDDVNYSICDGVSFKNGVPFAELIDLKGEMHYNKLI